MPVRDLTSFPLIGTAEGLLNLDLPKLGEILLLHLNSWNGQGKVWQPVGGLSRGYFVQVMEGTERGLGPPRRNEPEYGSRQPEVTRRMLEAWHWLVTKDLVMRTPDQPHPDFFVITSEGQNLITRLAAFERWERMGLDRVKSDLMHNDGKRTVQVGKRAQELDLAWEWVRMKEKQSTELSQQSETRKPKSLSQKVFVVHGHDEGGREQALGRELRSRWFQY